MNIARNSVLIKRETSPQSHSATIGQKYMEYAKAQARWRILWYMKVIIAIPCVFMVIPITAMAVMTPNYVWFVGLSMILFFINIMVHIAELNSTYFVPVFHLTVAILILIPVFTYFIV